MSHPDCSFFELGTFCLTGSTPSLLLFFERPDSVPAHINTESSKTTDSQTHQERHGLDAIGYITYAIVQVYVMLFNALSPVVWYESPYATKQVALCRSGSRGRFVISGVFVIETVINSLIMRFGTDWSTYFTESANMFSFCVNLGYITFGSFLVKMLLFSGIINVNGLTEWAL